MCRYIYQMNEIRVRRDMVVGVEGCNMKHMCLYKEL